MAKARDIEGLAPDVPFALAAARAVATRADEVFEHAAGVLDTSDIERVHDMRVATRRLRAVLEIFRPAFPKEAYRPLLREVKALADALGERRDPDVQLAALDGVRARLTRAEEPGLEAFAQRLRDAQASGNEALAAALDRVRRDGLHQRLRALAAGIEEEEAAAR